MCGAPSHDRTHYSVAIALARQTIILRRIAAICMHRDGQKSVMKIDTKRKLRLKYVYIIISECSANNTEKENTVVFDDIFVKIIISENSQAFV